MSARGLRLAVLLIAAGGGLAPTAYGQSITEFGIPTAFSTPEGIAAGPDGALWFTEDFGNKIGRITTAGVITEFAIPTAISFPQCLAAGSDRALWFTEVGGNRIGRITTAGVITEFTIPTANSTPQGITVGPDGALWFTEYANKIGRITTAGVITEFTIPTANSDPHEIAAGPDGALWFTERNSSKIGRITTVGLITEFEIPTPYSSPSGITAGPDGALWFTEVPSDYLLSGKIGRITTTGVVTEFADIYGGNITAGPDGALWFTEDSNKIGRITTAGVLTEFPIPTALSNPYGITAGPDGNLWFTEYSSNKIGRLSFSHCSLTCSAMVPSTSSAGAAVAFKATAVPSGCTGAPTYDWDFGDGSPHSSQQNLSHSYATAGAFTWHLTVKAGDQACQKTATINVVTPVGVVLQDIDDLRSPHRFEVRPGDTINLYYGLKDGSNNPITASSLLYSLTTSGMSPLPESLIWSPFGQGIAELTFQANQLGLAPGQTGQISFPTGLGVMQIDGLPKPVQGAPGAVSVTMLTTAFTDDWDLYAGGSAGVTGCLGVCLKAGSVTASLAAAELSVSGKGGAGLKITQAADNTLSFERRQEASLGVDLKVPSFEAALGAVSLNATGLDVGVERGVLTAQSFMYRGDKGLTSDEARMMNAACFLESASEMAIVATPFLGTLLKAVVTTATDLSDAPALINAGRIEERFEERFGGHLTLGIAGASPSVKLKGGGTVDGFGFSVTGADIEAAISTTGSTHYKEDGSGSVDTVSRGFQAAFAGSTGPLLVTPFIDCAIIGCSTYATTVGGSVIRDKTASALNGIQFGFETQSGTGIDLDLFRTQDYTGQAVTIDVKDLAITASLVADSLTHLAPIAGNAGAFPIGRQAFSDSLARSFSQAKALATGNTLAYLATVDATSGRVFDLTPSISIEIPHFPLQIDLGFELDYEHRRLVERSRKTAVLNSGNWLLAANSSTPSQADGPSLVDVLRTRVFSGIGPLIRSALVNLFGLFSDILPSRAAIASVIDPVTGRSGGSADFGDAYGGYRPTVATFDPSHPEHRSQTTAQGVVFPAAVRWGYTTKRVLPFGAAATREVVRQAEARGTTVMRLIGNALEVQLKDSNGIELSAFVPPVNLTFPLYADQIVRMGGDPAQVAETRVFRFDPEARGWSEVPATVAQNQQSVATSATLPGTYAPAQITSFDPNDSDQDGLLDSDEDKNGNGVVDPGETDPSNWDTDGDGVSDGTERALGTDPLDRNSVPNRAPILGYIGNKTIKVGESFSLALKSYDADGNTVTFFAQGLPPGASLDASTGLVTWTPSPAQVGPWHVLFTVQDKPTPGTGPAASDSEIVLFTVVGRTTRTVPFR